MNQKCNNIMDTFLSLDKHELVPFSVTQHLIMCKKCRTQVRMLTAAEDCGKTRTTTEQGQSHDFSDFAYKDESIEQLMKRIAPLPLMLPNTKPVSFSNWLIVGIILICTLCLIPISSAIGFFSHSFGAFFSIPFYIFVGITTTTYCTLFIASNLDFFIKKTSKKFPFLPFHRT